MTVILKYFKYTISLIALSAIFIGCESDYTRLVKSELAKGIRKDSVLLGIRLGDTRNEFYGKCFDLNKSHLAMQGEGFSVQYLFTDSLVHANPTPMRILFVPAFDDQDRITNIDLKFSYVGWAPWHKELQADTLKVKVMELLTRWYGGNKFVMAKVDGAEIPVKLDGNRRVVVSIFDPQSVVARVQDILHPKYNHFKSSKEGKKD
jgi:hypothetical protein